MFIEMTCVCVATFQIETEEDLNLGMLWAQQFVDAHRACGFMSNTRSDKPEVVKKIEFNINDTNAHPVIRRREKEDGLDEGGISV